MRFAAAFLLVASLCYSAVTPEEKALDAESFEYVWTTIRDKHWDKTLDGAEWKAAHDELRPKLDKATSRDADRKIIGELIATLHLTHFGIIPADVYSELHSGSANMDVRLIDGKPILVSGAHRGWEVTGVAEVIAKVEKVYQNSTMREMMVSRAVASAAGDRKLVLSDGQGGTVTPSPEEFLPRGEPTMFGNLPVQYVWTESRRIQNAGYFAFNLFLDPGRLVPALAEAVQSCSECRGFVIDLRGNPGGIGAMAYGMAGFFIDKPGEVLGTMQLRESSLKFAINPRTPQFTQKLAVLVDGLSASTSEIFAGGLQDLHRAKVFGSRTAGAALPSVIERLPNGDAFQYAIANYVSAGGAVLEGKGVKPDVEVRPRRASLLAGKDDVLDRALEWIQGNE